MKKKFLHYLFMLIFLLMIFSVPVLFLLQPKQAFSEREKRYLASPPAFSIGSFISGNFRDELSDYISDHFPFRNTFVGINAYYDLLSLRQGTKEYFLAQNGRLFAQPVKRDAAVLDKNLEILNRFSDALSACDEPIEVTVMLVPSSGSVLLEDSRYPDAEIADYVYRNVHAQTVDLYTAFRAADHPGALYYRTDHHWTSAGAYEAARLYTAQRGRAMPAADSYQVESCEGFYGSAYSASGLWLTRPDTLELWHSGTEVRVSDESGRTSSSVFFPDRLKEADKYTVFLDGNHSLVTIENLSGSGSERAHNLLVIRDSFSNSLGCFLSDCYDRIVLVDLRYYKLPLTDLIAEQNINEVLIEYSVENFMTDANLAFLSVDGEALAQKLLQRPAEQPPQETEAGTPEPEPPAEVVPTTYLAPPRALTDEFFDNTLYLGDSVIGTLGTYCAKNGKLPSTLISSNALLTYYEVATEWRGHLAYKGNFVVLREILEDTGATKIIGALGCNDLAQTNVEKCKENVINFLTLVREISPDITIFIQSVMPIQNVQYDFNQPEVDEFNAWLKESAEVYDYCYIELDKYFKGEDGTLSREYTYNPTHINLAGGSVWYEALLQPENYYNFPASLMVEYDIETGEPLIGAVEAPPAAEPGPSPAPVTESAPSPAVPAEERTALDAIYEEIARTVDLPEMLELNEEMLSVYLGLSPEDYKNGRFYVCSNNLKADEIWLVKLESEDAAAQMLEKARGRIEAKAQSYRNYLPEEYEVVSRGIAMSQGNTVVLFISPDAEAMLAAFRSAVQ